MIAPVHPELGRELQHGRREDLDRALQGCRWARRRPQEER
jgi:hypothetical protein